MRKCCIEGFMTIKRLQEPMSGDQLTSKNWDATYGSDVILDLLEKNNEDPNERKDPLIQL